MYTKIKYNPLTGEFEFTANTPGGGGMDPLVSKNEVTFYDYDGTILYSYSASEFLTLTELPPLPTRPGLICQEWNWSYKEAMSYVQQYGILDIGATYITDDGKTRLYIRIAAEGRMDVPLYFQQTKANGVVIDWGDGSATQTLNGTGNVNTTHHYSSVGDYIISLDVADGCTLGLGHGNNTYGIMGASSGNGLRYYGMLRKVEIGSNINSILNFSFRYCYSLMSITLPNSITTFGSVTFLYNYSLISVIIPRSVDTLGSQTFQLCSSLKLVVLPNKMGNTSYQSFQDCTCLALQILPSSISLGENLFKNCSLLSSVVFPGTVQSIAGGAFSSCSSVAFYDFSYHNAVPTLANVNVFTGIPSDCKIIVPDALYDKWIAATNWSTYASYIIKKTDWNKLQQ